MIAMRVETAESFWFGFFFSFSIYTSMPKGYSSVYKVGKMHSGVIKETVELR